MNSNTRLILAIDLSNPPSVVNNFVKIAYKAQIQDPDPVTISGCLNVIANCKNLNLNVKSPRENLLFRMILDLLEMDYEIKDNEIDEGYELHSIEFQDSQLSLSTPSTVRRYPNIHQAIDIITIIINSINMDDYDYSMIDSMLSACILTINGTNGVANIDTSNLHTIVTKCIEMHQNLIVPILLLLYIRGDIEILDYANIDPELDVLINGMINE